MKFSSALFNPDFCDLPSGQAVAYGRLRCRPHFAPRLGSINSASFKLAQSCLLQACYLLVVLFIVFSRGSIAWTKLVLMRGAERGLSDDRSFRNRKPSCGSNRAPIRSRATFDCSHSLAKAHVESRRAGGVRLRAYKVDSCIHSHDVAVMIARN